MSSFLLIKCPFLAQICIRKALLPHMSSILILNEFYSPHSLSKKLCYPNMSSFLLYTCPSLTPFPARKALLPLPPPPHLSSFMLITCPSLDPFSIKKALLNHRSTFLLIPCLFLSNSLSKTFVS